MLLYSFCAFFCVRNSTWETFSEPVPASVRPFRQKRQGWGTGALQHTPTLGLSISAWLEQGDTSQLLQSLPLPVESTLGNEVGEAAGGHLVAVPGLAACRGGQIRA